MQYFWLTVIVVGLLVLSVAYAVRQVQTLRWLRTQEQMAADEHRYYRWRSYRRLLGCVLTATLAFLLAGLYFYGILEGLDRLMELGPQAREAGQHLNEEEQAFMRFSQYYVGSIALVIFIWIGVAFIDAMATRRYGLRQRKRLRDDRQAMLARQLPLLRRERNGQG